MWKFYDALVWFQLIISLISYGLILFSQLGIWLVSITQPHDMCAGIEISNQLFIKKLKKKRQQQQQKHHIFNLMHAISILLPRRTRYFHESRYIYVRDSFSFVAICYCGCFDENFLGYYANGNVIFKKLYDFKCDSKSLARQSRKNIQNIPGTFTVFGSKFLKILHIQRAPCYMHKQHRHRNIIRFVAACKHLLEN